ncbi:MAG TPA: site-2 protease family protein [Clostridia bacterium]|nr:site-2 protease family protein [Clostridia bacterium]
MSFTLFAIGKTRVRLNALFLLPALLAFFTGNGYAFLLTLVSLSLHEAAHAAMTYACGLQIAEIVIEPLGLSAKLGGVPPTLGDELAIASAGPVFSLTAGIAAALVHQSGLLASANVALFGSINTLLAFANLLPAPPLDGSAMLRALLERRFSGRAVRATLGIAGFAVSLLMGGVSVVLFLRGGSFYLTAAAAALVLISTFEELVKSRGGRVGAMLRRNSALGAARCVSVRTVALAGDTRAGDALRLAVTGQYTRFIVVGRNMRELGALNENDLYEGSAKWGENVTLQSLLSASIDQRRTW